MSDSPSSTGFLVLHGNRLEDLRDLVIDVIRQAPLPPLSPEVFLVQSNGMKHWLQQALADESAFGICAATDIDLPSTFLWRAYRAVLGREAVPSQLVFDKGALTWRLLRLLPACVKQDPTLYAPLAHYLHEDRDGRRAWQLAQQVADVFDGYQQYRADWLDAWERGEPTTLTSEHRWQPALWRALRADVGVSHANTSRAAVHRAFVAAMAGQPATTRPVGLPSRLFVFGISALPMQAVEALAELGRVCQVIMVAQNPCQYYWGDVVERRELVRRCRTPRADLDLHAEAPPLLASLGKQGRDYLHLLDQFDQTESTPHRLPRVDVFTDPGCHSRLARLQSAILNLDPLPPQPEDVPEDDSIEFVQAHSAQREVEVLHDRLLALLDADDALQLSDIMVMVPDMTNFVSHIQAVFGRFEKNHKRHLPYSVADTSPREEPLVKALERLLHLPDSRIALTDWLSLFEVAAVRRRFGLTESDIEALHDALDRAVVRWGLDGEHRVDQGLPAGLATLEQNTWAAGLERLLLGYAMPDDTVWQDVLPVLGVGGLAAQRVGALSQWLEAVRMTRHDLQKARRPEAWAWCLAALLDRFFDAKGDEEAERLLHRLREQLAAWLQRCATGGFDQDVPLLVVREHWLAAVESNGLQQRFFGGGVQFSTLMPMRSIPFKVVCLLGMNDTDYPRRSTPRDFDLMTHEWRPGDRSRRDDDRYLFLEALLSARAKLYVSWVGRRSTDNAELPPSVVVGQLRDELARRFLKLGEPVLQPLQPFSGQYFKRPPNNGPVFSTYDNDWQPVDATALPPRVPGAGTADLALPTEITLEELQRFVKQPVETYWRRRLQVRLDEPDEAVDDDEPFELDALDEHQAKSGFIDDCLAVGPEEARHRLRRSGRLPIGAEGERLLDELVRDAMVVVHRSAALRNEWIERDEAVDFELDIEGLTVRGTVNRLRSREGHWLQLALRPGAIRKDKRLRYDKLLTAWVTQVCLEAAGYPVHTVFCGPDAEATLPSFGEAAARSQLEDWLRGWRAGWTMPLPIASKTALERLHPSRAEDDEHLQQVFEGTDFLNGERDWSPYLTRSFEGFADIRKGIDTWAVPLYGRLVDVLAPERSGLDDQGDEA